MYVCTRTKKLCLILITQGMCSGGRPQKDNKNPPKEKQKQK